MPNRPGRRRFLVESRLTVLGVPMLTACRTRSDEQRTPSVPATLIAWLESEVPRLLASSRVPGLAIALVSDGRVAWYRGFGVRHGSSGEGYSYLQLVVSRLTGRIDASRCETMWDGLKVCATQLDDYLRRNLFGPFGMSSSGLLLDPAVSDRAADTTLASEALLPASALAVHADLSFPADSAAVIRCEALVECLATPAI